MWLEAADFEGMVIDLDEQRPVRRWVRVDPDQGLVEAVQEDTAGRPLFGEHGPVTYLGKGRFECRLRPRRKAVRVAPPADAPQICGQCDSSMVLPGDELCAVCRARQQGRRIRVEPVSNLLLPRGCDNRCGRRAVWSVIDETPVTPVLGWRRFGGSYRRALFKRASIIGRRWYCSHCYKPPRVLDANGEVMSVEEESGPDLLPRERR